MIADRASTSTAVGIAMLIVLTANIFGLVLPLLMDKIGVHPAVASNPVITSVTDRTSLSIYLGIAVHIL